MAKTIREDSQKMANKMKVFVVLATYNGEKYIIELLESIRAQTRAVDGMFIVDDCSQDCTQALVQSFIRKYHLDEFWHYGANEKNLGHVATFTQAAQTLDDGILFFCDQDDIWEPNKIEVMLKPFEKSQTLAAVCSFSCIDSNGRPCNSIHNMMRMYSMKKYRTPSFSHQVKTLESPGLTLATRTGFYKGLIPTIRSEHLAHDTPVGLAAAYNRGLVRVARPLVKRRIHEGNVSKPEYSVAGKLSNFERYSSGREFQLNHLRAFRDMLGGEADKRFTQEIESRKKSLQGLDSLSPGVFLPRLFSLNPYCNHAIEAANMLVAIRQRIVGKTLSIDDGVLR